MVMEFLGPLLAEKYGFSIKGTLNTSQPPSLTYKVGSHAAKRDQEFKGHHPDLQSTSSHVPFMDCIELAACAADETLPMTPELPAELFTSCLTSPIKIALRYFVLQNRPRISVTIDEIMQI